MLEHPRGAYLGSHLKPNNILGADYPYVSVIALALHSIVSLINNHGHVARLRLCWILSKKAQSKYRQDNLRKSIYSEAILVFVQC